MVVYVGDNLETGERIISYNEKAFVNVLKETFGPRFLEAIEVYVFDLDSENILEDTLDRASKGEHLPIAVLNYAKEKGGL